MKLLGLITLALVAPLVSAIWPIPSEYDHGSTTLWIDNDVKIAYNVNTIFEQNFVPWKFNERNSDFEPPTADKKCITSITLQQTKPDSTGIATPEDTTVDESYTLTVPEAGDVTIIAASSIGLVHGLTTFSQLFFKHTEGGAYTNLAPVNIKDAPKFAHRGFNMDVSRSYYPVADIKRVMDAMAFTKFNRFHLHITDAQSWPLVIPALPELSAKGAFSPDMVYTPADLKDIQYYGTLLGIETILEIDMPGHTSSVAFSQPELIAAFNIQPDWSTYCAEPPCGTFKLNDTRVYDFLNTVLDDLLPRVKPYSAYFHTGGDEVNVQAYLHDDTVKSNDTAVLKPLMQKFVDRNHDQVRNAGLTPIVWEEMLLTWNLTLGKDVLVQTWQSDEAVAQTVASGHKALVGNYNYWYLDCGKGQWLDFSPETAQTYYPFNDYCNPRKNWRLMYSYDPYGGVPKDLQHLVVGGECHLWMEQTDSVNLDSMLWPRAAAAAEVLWSGPKDAQGNNRSQIEASPRLSDFRERLVARGVKAEPIQMPFCTMNGTQCSLISMSHDQKSHYDKLLLCTLGAGIAYRPELRPLETPCAAIMLEQLFDRVYLLSLVAFLIVLYASRQLASGINASRRIRALGGHAPVRISYVPFGLDLVYQIVKSQNENRSLQFWRELFSHWGNPLNPYTIETGRGGLRAVITADPENIKAILATQFADYGKGEQFNRDWHDFLGDSIFTTDGDKWHHSRQLIRPQFIRDRLSDLKVFESHIPVLRKHLYGNGETVDVKSLFFRYTLDVATDFLLGHSVNSLEYPQARFAEAFARAQHTQSLRSGAGPMSWILPERGFHKDIRTINEFIHPFIEETLALSPEELEKKTKNDEGYTFLHALAGDTRDRSMLRDQLVAVLLAGRDTTACTLSWLFYELSTHPEILRKLRKEITEIVGEDNKPTYEHLKSLKYLQHTLNETLRLYPVVPFNVRFALHDTTLPRGGGPDGNAPIGVLKDTSVAYSTLIMQRREDIFPPTSVGFPPVEEFVPERWDDWTPKPWTYIPFNGGPRLCVGQQFALTEMAYTVVRLLQQFERIECRMDGHPGLKSDIVLQPANDIHVALWSVAQGGK
ncbi:glycoside hydrolase family 20 protein [Aplosporella prunicola CBS 121167]|uniref:beta-N-acetylhexosaminidase n=1 Tax=Aplosporella prunicola CBS 121167 TaxID=1176127 RepID=A0A6A6BWU5_9PEZI|nr:glycoside hydrolase family 20 protein [Aplosporella prunicola CBS 121167]KAF2147191.1 glycoside hydrolase family 20 protein [Aplosporella prunicola CBS 121167]